MRVKMTAFEEIFNKESCFIMEGALGLRLQREFGLQPDTNAALALTVRSERGRAALNNLWREYYGIASNFGLPFLAAAPARRLDSAPAAAGGLGRELTARNLDFMRSVMRKKTNTALAETANPPSASRAERWVALSMRIPDGAALNAANRKNITHGKQKPLPAPVRIIFWPRFSQAPPRRRA